MNRKQKQARIKRATEQTESPRLFRKHLRRQEQVEQERAERAEEESRREAERRHRYYAETRKRLTEAAW